MPSPVTGFRPVKIADLAAVDEDLAVRLTQLDEGAGGNKSGVTDFAEFAKLEPAERTRYNAAVEKLIGGAPHAPGVVERAANAVGKADWMTIEMTGNAAADVVDQLGGKAAGNVVRGLSNAFSQWKFWNG